MDQLSENFSEQKQRLSFYKLCSVCGIFLRWVFIVFLTIILTLGLYFKAPWKIMVLDASILVMLTIVPKRYRKYGRNAILLIVLGITAWIFLPESDSGNWKPYTFDAEVNALNEKYSVPEEENAATYYNQIELTDFYEGWTWEDHLDPDAEKRGPSKWDPDDETLKRPWGAEEFPELAAWLETEKQNIAPFFKAAQLEQCWFEETLTPNPFERNERAVTLRSTGEITKRIIYNDLSNNQIDNAFTKSLALIQLSKHLQQQYAFQENILSYSLYIRLTPIICDIIINYPVDNQKLDCLEDIIKSSLITWDDSVESVLEHEKIILTQAFAQGFEVNQKGKIRNAKNFIDPSNWEASFSDIEFTKDNKPYVNKPRFLPLYWQERRWKFNQFWSWMTNAATPKEIASVIDDIYTHEMPSLIRDNDKLPESEGLSFLLDYNFSLESVYRLLCVELQVPAIKKIKETYSRIEITQRGLSLVIAIRRFRNQHGDWPGSLADIDYLKDDFLYKKTGEQFYLYHIGPNNLDDKGRREGNRRRLDPKTSRWIKVPTADDVLIWPQNEEELEKFLPKEPENENIDRARFRELMGL